MYQSRCFYIDIIAEHYHLKPYPRQLLEDAARVSRNRIRISLPGQPNYRRDLAVSFEDHFDQIDEDISQTMMNLMKGEGEKQDV